jgi:hypothetical protein
MENSTSIAQDRETLPEVVIAGDIAFRYTFGRSADCRLYNDTGQDYITFSQLPGGLVFALCDGVSQSFMGNLAARFLGDSLIEWLAGLPPGSEPEAVKESLLSSLTELAEKAGEEINNHPLPESIPALLRTVLEEKRALGSESTFVCGRIDLPNASNPAGSFIAAWMGDSRLRLWNPARESWQRSVGFLNANQRWSSRRGAVGGAPNILAAPLLDREGKGFNLAHLMVYSDGLTILDKVDVVLSNIELETLINQVTKSAQSDDVSLFEVWLGGLPEEVCGKESRTIKVPLGNDNHPAVEPEKTATDSEKTVEITPAGSEKTVEITPLDESGRTAVPEPAITTLEKKSGIWKFLKKGGNG